MKFIKKLLPRSIKNKIKAAAGITNDTRIMQISADIASRKIAKSVAANNIKFKNKIVVVTGASGFIGKAIALRFLEDGAVVYACGRNKEKLEKTFEDTPNSSLFFLQMDITSSDSVKKAFNTILEQHKKIDILVNCAGGSARDDWSYIYNQKDEVISDIINTNLYGTLLCIKYASKCMIENHYGKIINIASTVGVGGKAGFSEYAASKAGIIGATKSLAIELGEHGITVNCVTPGIVNRGDFSESKLNEIIEKNCLRSIGTADDISYGVTFFASDEANFITGQNVIIDGGRSLGLKGD
ncbi:MAG: SDR family oxidoreductase [Clostridia bacterium]|nr:SDR family oxidoreductase [Clostridia bacterium]